VRDGVVPRRALETDAPSAQVMDFAELIVSEQTGLLRLARRLVWDAEEARDLVQTTLAEGYEKRAVLRDPVAARAWLRRILVSRALNHLQRRRLWASLRDLILPSDEVESHELRLDGIANMEALSRAVARLPARQTAAFTLRYVEGLPLSEVAEAMGIDRGTVKVHLYRALRALKAEVPSREGSDDDAV
jgi:RNA polymerase sigma-70 factor (ECF subfamily)